MSRWSEITTGHGARSFDSAQLEQIRQSLTNQQAYTLVTPPFTKITSFSNNWVAYGSTFAAPGFTRGADFIVRLQGLAKRSSGTPSASELITVLPAGFRPEAQLVFVVASGDAGPSNAYGRVDVLADGSVKWITGSAGATAFVSLDAISFRAAN